MGVLALATASRWGADESPGSDLISMKAAPAIKRTPPATAARTYLAFDPPRALRVRPEFAFAARLAALSSGAGASDATSGSAADRAAVAFPFETGAGSAGTTVGAGAGAAAAAALPFGLNIDRSAVAARSAVGNRSSGLVAISFSIVWTNRGGRPAL